MKKSKHQQAVDNLEQILNNAKSIDRVETNLLYPSELNNLG